MVSQTVQQIPPYVREPEYILKHRKRLRAITQRRIQKATEQKIKSVKRRQEAYKRAEKYYAEYVHEKEKQISDELLAKSEGNFYVKPEAKLAFVIRIRGVCNVPPAQRKALQLLRLRKRNAGVFVKINDATLGLLKLVEPYVAWGYPDLTSVRALFYKRAYLKSPRGRVPLSSNEQIENLLGKHNVICLEDIVHQIYTVGDKFKEVNNTLFPFSLKPSHMKAVKKHFIEGGDFGNREHFINDLIRRMI